MQSAASRPQRRSGVLYGRLRCSTRIRSTASGSSGVIVGTIRRPTSISSDTALCGRVVVGAEPLDLAWIGLARGDQLPNLDEEPLDPAGHISVHAPGGSVGSIRERVHDAGRDEDERAGLGVERLSPARKLNVPSTTKNASWCSRWR
jgi:hypothetical protein